MSEENLAEANEKIIAKIAAEIGAKKCRSAWARGVQKYALELVEKLTEHNAYEPIAEDADWGEIEKRLLNGADDWRMYSEGGCALIYDEDIGERLCPPSIYKRFKHTDGSFYNHDNEWINIYQPRALAQAAHIVITAFLAARV